MSRCRNPGNCRGEAGKVCHGCKWTKAARKRVARKIRKIMMTPERREKTREWSLMIWQRPGFREHIRESVRRLWQDPEYRERMREKAREKWRDPEYRQMMKARAKLQWQNPDYRERMLAAMRRTMTPESRAKIRSARVRSILQPFLDCHPECDCEEFFTLYRLARVKGFSKPEARDWAYEQFRGTQYQEAAE